jgi:hypothetical protein
MLAEVAEVREELLLRDAARERELDHRFRFPPRLRGWFSEPVGQGLLAGRRDGVTVRRRLPRGSEWAEAKPWAISFFGSA